MTLVYQGMGLVKFYLLATQLFVMHFWFITNKSQGVYVWKSGKNIFTLLTYWAWGFVFFSQLILSNVLLINTSFGNLFEIFGITIYSLGVLLAIWSKYSLGTSWGLPEQHNKEIQKKLVIKGPYKFSRNPIYLSELIMLLGFELVLKSWLILLVVPFYLFNLKKILSEEKLLDQFFGKEYLNYKMSVRRFF